MFFELYSRAKRLQIAVARDKERARWVDYPRYRRIRQRFLISDMDCVLFQEPRGKRRF